MVGKEWTNDKILGNEWTNDKIFPFRNNLFWTGLGGN